MAKIPTGTAKLAVTAAGCTVGAMAGIGTVALLRSSLSPILFPFSGIFGCLAGGAIGGILARARVWGAGVGEVVPRHSGAAPGGRIAADLVPKGRSELRPVKSPGSIDGFIGILRRPGAKALSIEEIGEIAAQGWAGRR
ncbi:MAG: hypothetical protein ACREFK_06160 [Stellaceae bacterium]